MGDQSEVSSRSWTKVQRPPKQLGRDDLHPGRFFAALSLRNYMN
jgi:hypothetical protein